MVAKPVGVEDIGTEVICPKCGARGRVAVERVTAGGKTYLYLSVRHVLGHGRAKRCLIRRLTDEEVAKTPMVAKNGGDKNGGGKKPATRSPRRVVAKPLVVEKQEEVAKSEVVPKTEVAKSLEQIPNTQVPDARILDEIRALREQLQALQAALAQLQQSKIQAEEDKGEFVEGIVTKDDPRRGKVYVPIEWLGRKVRVQLLE